MKGFYYISTIPFIVIGKAFIFLNIFNLKEKLNKCVEMVDTKGKEIPEFFIPYLVAAEDHRSSYHYGIDQVGILRAFFVRITKNEVQGASTVEQQFVRVVTGDYTRSLLRKFKEQLLAISLVSKRSKTHIGKAYLAIAFYGNSYKGTEGILGLLQKDIMLASELEVISIVARLKYPKPSKKSLQWESNHYQRVQYIKNRHFAAANKPRQRMLRNAA